MPRRISQIKDPKLRKLAELRREQFESSDSKENELANAFVWNYTPDNYDFWYWVELDIITELPKDHPLHDEL